MDFSRTLAKRSTQNSAQAAERYQEKLENLCGSPQWRFTGRLPAHKIKRVEDCTSFVSQNLCAQTIFRSVDDLKLARQSLDETAYIISLLKALKEIKSWYDRLTKAVDRNQTEAEDRRDEARDTALIELKLQGAPMPPTEKPRAIPIAARKQSLLRQVTNADDIELEDTLGDINMPDAPQTNDTPDDIDMPDASFLDDIPWEDYINLDGYEDP